MAAKVLMIQGTGSHVGKSLLTAALCRIFTQDGLRVRPFKAQNMSNNAHVTADGGEMGRAQAEQAKACGVEPSVLMNPILLKPSTDVGAQVIVLGRAVRTMTAQDYEAYKPSLRATVTGALEQVMAHADLVLIEGAGSPAEINLRDGDLVNMWIAKQAHAPVLLVGNIDWGGVFAQLVGTMELLEPEERRLVRGFVINKFRGDQAILDPGLRWLEARYGLPVIGTLPYLPDIELLEEDAVPDPGDPEDQSENLVRIDVVKLPRMSNFTDLAPLEREPDVRLRYITRPPADGSMPDCLIVPGSKSTIADLEFLRRQSLDRYVVQCVEAGREVVGVCGGFQMLGRHIHDPARVEASVTSAEGLGLLPVAAVFESSKVTRQVRGIHLDSGLQVEGYEIHMGRMQALAPVQPVFALAPAAPSSAPNADGAQAFDGRVWGTHLHGLFDAAAFRRWWLNRLRQRKRLLPIGASASGPEDGVYDRLAQALRPHLDMGQLHQILGL